MSFDSVPDGLKLHENFTHAHDFHAVLRSGDFHGFDATVAAAFFLDVFADVFVFFVVFEFVIKKGSNDVSHVMKRRRPRF